MPNYKVHALGGIILFGIYFLIRRDVEIFIYIPVAIIYSLLPDIDHPNSKLGKLLRKSLLMSIPIILVVAYLYKLNYYYALIPMTILAILSIIPHRKIIHTLKAGIIFSIPLIIISFNIALFGLLNYFLHLAIDKKIKL